jgi:ribokinase
VSDVPVDVVVVGSHAPGLRVDVDQFPQPGETVLGHGITWPLDGGKGSNQAIAAAELGARVAFVGRVGTDDLGDSAADLLVRRGIDIRHLSRSETMGTGCGVNIVDRQGIPEMIVVLGANAELNTKHVSAALESYRTAKVVLTQMEIDPYVALHAARVGKAHGAISIVNAAPAAAWLLSSEDLAETIDILVVNETEARMLDVGSAQATGDEADLAARLRVAVASRSVVITLGKRGLVAEHDGERWQIDGAVVTTVDTSGAGDVFCAALAVGIATGMSVREACIWANVAAGISVTRAGTIPSFPSLEEVDGANRV